MSEELIKTFLETVNTYVQVDELPEHETARATDSVLINTNMSPIDLSGIVL